VDWIHGTRDSDKRQAAVNTEMKLRFHKMQGIS
jgi:hypothetical protein